MFVAFRPEVQKQRPRFCENGSSRSALLCSIFYIICAISLAGCAPSLEAGPTRLFPIEQEAEAIKTQIGLPDFHYYASMDSADRTSYRNKYITAEMYAIDLMYSDYETALTRERQDVGLLSKAAIIGLTSAATLTAGVAAKNILTASATGVTGLESGYSEEVLFKQTIPVLQAQMRANRAMLAANILKKLRFDDSQYPLFVALSDVESYYNAGTLTGALVAVNASTSEAATYAEQNKSDVITYNVAEDASATYLRSLLTSAGAYNYQIAGKLRDLLAQYGVTTPLAEIVSLPQFLSVRERLARDIARLQAGGLPKSTATSKSLILLSQVPLDATSVTLENYLVQSGHISPERETQVRNAAMTKGFPKNSSLSDLITLPKYTAIRKYIISILKI